MLASESPERRRLEYCAVYSGLVQPSVLSRCEGHKTVVLVDWTVFDLEKLEERCTQPNITPREQRIQIRAGGVSTREAIQQAQNFARSPFRYGRRVKFVARHYNNGTFLTDLLNGPLHA